MLEHNRSCSWQLATRMQHHQEQEHVLNLLFFNKCKGHVVPPLRQRSNDRPSARRRPHSHPLPHIQRIVLQLLQAQALPPQPSPWGVVVVSCNPCCCMLFPPPVSNLVPRRTEFSFYRMCCCKRVDVLAVVPREQQWPGSHLEALRIVLWPDVLRQLRCSSVARGAVPVSSCPVSRTAG